MRDRMNSSAGAAAGEQAGSASTMAAYQLALVLARLEPGGGSESAVAGGLLNANPTREILTNLGMALAWGRTRNGSVSASGGGAEADN